MRGALGDRSVRFATTGLGRRRTSANLSRLLESDRPDLLIFTGTAGQLDPRLRMGQVVLPRRWAFADGDGYAVNMETVVWPPGESPVVVEDLGLTVARPVVRARSRLKLYRDHGAAICDMESASALQAAAVRRVPCIAPKVVSDTADTGLGEYWRAFESNMHNLTAALSQLLRLVRLS